MVAHPAAPARVWCPGCGVFLLGPGLDEAQRAELRIAEGLADVALRETYLLARERGTEGRAVSPPAGRTGATGTASPGPAPA
jgi:hypothetical protein